MDRITQAHLNDFQAEQSVSGLPESVLFEHFANYCILSEVQDDDFNFLDIHTGGDGDLNQDGLAIVVNGRLVESADDIQPLLEHNNYLDVKFIFIQAKTSSNFDSSDMHMFGEGVLEFFSDNPSRPVNDAIADRREIMSRIYEHSTSFKNGNPKCELHYVTTGKWVDDKNLKAIMGRMVTELEDKNIFDSVKYEPYGAREVGDLWRRTKNSTKVEFVFDSKVTLPAIEGVTESYVGILPFSEFKKIIIDADTGSIRRHIFTDNVRDYQGDNPVNNEMKDSLSTEAGVNRFAVLNNGVTIVARDLSTVGTKFTISDFQIVNGCQTSHVLQENVEEIDGSMTVPVKVVVTRDDEVATAITKATNRQTQVTDEDLMALSTFQKDIEAFLRAQRPQDQLFYERRSRQFSATPVEKVRVITKVNLMKTFAAMYLGDPRRAASYYGELRPHIGKEIFNPQHQVEPYYTAAYAYYRLEHMFRNRQKEAKYKPARYHLLYALRHLASGSMSTDSLTSAKAKREAIKVTAILQSDVKWASLVTEATAVIDVALGGASLSRDYAKTSAFQEAVTRALKEKIDEKAQ